jgi:FkbM family methyltransferase
VPRFPGQAELDAWHEGPGDRTLRFEYDLDQGSLVWDVGGFRGDWAAEIAARYRSRIEVFEPVVGFAEEIRHRFARNEAVTVHAYGLAGRSRRELIALSADSSSVMRAGDQTEAIELIDIAGQINGVPAIDLMKINIEGGEYELLDRLLETGEITRVHRLQVQFHDLVPDAEARMDGIRARLAETHTCVWRFPWVWESWEVASS